MTDDRGMKSAYELAMERLKKQDKDAGIERKPLTEQQKAAIAEIRNVYDAKLAEADLRHQDKMLMTLDAGDRDKRDEEYRRDRERLSAERDAKIEKVRASS
jgi:hypothetical protein